MDVFEAIAARRSVREYRADAVGRQVLEQIVAAGVEERIRPLSKALTGAPAVIVLVMDPQGTPFGEFWIQDASAAMENMLLAAVALGHASCWVEGAIRRCEQQLREILSVPEDLRVWSLMPVGLAAEAPQRPPKPSAAEVTHYNRYGG